MDELNVTYNYKDFSTIRNCTETNYDFAATSADRSYLDSRSILSTIEALEEHKFVNYRQETFEGCSVFVLALNVKKHLDQIQETAGQEKGK